MKKRVLRHKYYLEELAGRGAERGSQCPYRDLGRRCAWLAGYRDANETGIQQRHYLLTVPE